MATGEGKTLVATMPVYLNALTGRGVHVVTVNDYLAARDSEWMGAVYRFLGLTVGCILHDQSPKVRREQYECDITYGTNAEFGFDYLRDNGMAIRREDQVQRGHYFAVVDEVDSILVDEARTPLIISGPALVNADNNLYAQFKPQVESLVSAQAKLCRRYISEAEALLKKLRPEDASNPPNPEQLEQEIGLLLYRVKVGAADVAGIVEAAGGTGKRAVDEQGGTRAARGPVEEGLNAQKEELFFAIDEKSHDADLTEKGRTFMNPKDPDGFMLPDLGTALHEVDNGPEPDARKRLEMKAKLQQDFETKAQSIHAISQLLKAYSLHQGRASTWCRRTKVIIVDENTGPVDDRAAVERWFAPGMVEAKEGVEIERETQTLATITIQNYFPVGQETGGHDVEPRRRRRVGVPGYLQAGRGGGADEPGRWRGRTRTIRCIKTKREKLYAAVIKEIEGIHHQGRPILVGATVSVEVSELLSRMLKKAGIIHSVLNASFTHQQEAEIVARAGQRGVGDDRRDEHGRARHGHQAGAGHCGFGRVARDRHGTSRVAAH